MEMAFVVVHREKNGPIAACGGAIVSGSAVAVTVTCVEAFPASSTAHNLKVYVIEGKIISIQVWLVAVFANVLVIPPPPVEQLCRI